MNYNKTLCLPKTKFPMRAELPKKEPGILSLWDRMDIYEKIRKKSKGRKKYILHDGPPYANGDVHLGTARNKVLKDIIIKFKSLRGFHSPYVPGWDCHGMPIEHEVTKKFQDKEVSQAEIRKRCKEYALHYVGVQRKQFKRLGVFGDWDNPYLTLHPEYEAKIVEIFGELLKRGYIYQGLRPIHWCMNCQTALAEAELEYKDRTSPSIYVKFKLVSQLSSLPLAQFKTSEPANRRTGEPATYVIIWTTTPWTLLGNVAIAFHPTFDYQLLKVGNEIFIMLKELVAPIMEKVGIENFEILDTIKGKSFEGLECQHPFLNRRSRLILADYVTKEDGTGCVHTAPGHGEEDYQSGVKYDLPILSPVSERGEFTSEAGDFKGQNVFKANEGIIKKLKETGNLIYEGTLIHSYPHCWRCKNPVIFRATEQWFISVDHKNLRRRALTEIDKVEWIPEWGERKMSNMVSSRPDWCISRQRAWGVPIPAFYCRDCGTVLLTPENVDRFRKLVEKEGVDAWFHKKPQELLPPNAQCLKCGGTNFEKQENILDVWFEAGVSWAAVLEERKELQMPADLYLEAGEQHRGWFQLSLLLAVATRDRAPYRSVLTYGLILDAQGRKMSKSLGNVIVPEAITDKYGADILRLWFVSVDYTADVSLSDNGLEPVVEAYRKIRNTCRYILGNLYDFEPSIDRVEYEDLMEVDRWALLRCQKLLKKATKHYDRFNFHRLYHEIQNFCIVDLSSLYLDILKDRLYTQGKNSPERRSAQTVLYEILLVLVKIMAPILPYTTEEVWEYLPGEKEGSVHLSDWPKINERFVNKKLEERWERLISIREKVLVSLEEARREKRIGNSLEAEVEIHSKKEYEFLKEYEKNLPTLLIVSGVRLEKKGKEITVKVGKAPGEKCSRCWNYSIEVGRSKEHPTLCPRCIEVVKKYYS